MPKPPRTTETRIEGHKEKIEGLQAKLRIQQARLGHLATKKRTEDERKRTRQKIIVGAALLNDAAMHPETARLLANILNRAIPLERKRDRTDIGNILAGDFRAYAKTDKGQE